MLDEVVASVSLVSRRSLGGAGCEAAMRALGQLLRAGVNVSLCTEDPTMSQQCDHALGLEYSMAQSMLGLSRSDLAEIARFSSNLAKVNPAAMPPAAEAGGESAKGGDASGTKGQTIRERYRSGRRQAELALISRLAPMARAGML